MNKIFQVKPTQMTQHKYVVETDNSVFHQKFYLNDHERKELLTELNSTALVLFEYYLRLACNQQKNPELSDINAAKDLGMNYHTVRKQRSQLEKKGWILISKTPKNKAGHRANLYFLGKNAVAQHTSFSAERLDSILAT